MPDPHVRELGRIEDFDGVQVGVGVDYDCVVVNGRRFTTTQAEEFAQLFVAACIQAARCGIEQELETREETEKVLAVLRERLASDG